MPRKQRARLPTEHTDLEAQAYLDAWEPTLALFRRAGFIIHSFGAGIAVQTEEHGSLTHLRGAALDIIEEKLIRAEGK